MDTPTPALQALERAISINGLAELARRCGVSHQVVQRWRKSGYVPAERVIAVEKATESRVTRYDLRPDVYPREWETGPNPQTSAQG